MTKPNSPITPEEIKRLRELYAARKDEEGSDVEISFSQWDLYTAMEAALPALLDALEAAYKREDFLFKCVELAKVGGWNAGIDAAANFVEELPFKDRRVRSAEIRALKPPTDKRVTDER